MTQTICVFIYWNIKKTLINAERSGFLLIFFECKRTLSRRRNLEIPNLQDFAAF